MGHGFAAEITQSGELWTSHDAQFSPGKIVLVQRTERARLTGR